MKQFLPRLQMEMKIEKLKSDYDVTEWENHFICKVKEFFKEIRKLMELFVHAYFVSSA